MARAQGLNRAYLIGRAVATPELRTGPNGTHVAALMLAVPSARMVDGAWQEGQDEHRIVAHGDDAAWLAATAGEGDAVAVECEVRPDRWTDRNGCTRTATSLVLVRVMWLSKAARVTT